MAYIESHQSLSRHRKTLASVSALRVDRHKLLGHLHELWWWGLDNADISGLVGHVSHEVIAEAAGWPLRDAERFVETLLSVGFMDPTPDGLVLHDWPDYAGKLNERREQNRERMRRARAQRKPNPDPPTERSRAGHVQRTNGAQPAHVADTFDARAPATGAKLNKAQLNEPELPPAASQQPPTTFSDDEQIRIDQVRTILVPLGLEGRPEFWHKVLDKYGDLDLETEAFKQADWLRRNKKRQCSELRYLNWLHIAAGKAPNATAQRGTPEDQTRYSAFRKFA